MCDWPPERGQSQFRRYPEDLENGAWGSSAPDLDGAWGGLVTHSVRLPPRKRILAPMPRLFAPEKGFLGRFPLVFLRAQSRLTRITTAFQSPRLTAHRQGAD